MRAGIKPNAMRAMVRLHLLLREGNVVGGVHDEYAGGAGCPAMSAPKKQR